MIRSCSLAVTFVLVACWMTAFAQPPGGDPAAKGSVTIAKITVNKSTVTVEGTTDEAEDWTGTGPSVFAIPKGVGASGAYIWGPPMVAREVGSDEWSVTFSLPKGSYHIWAIYELSKSPDLQRVGSVLSEASVTDSTITTPAAAASIKFTKGPTREQGGSFISGEGSGSIIDPTTWELVPTVAPDKPINLDMIPTGGGVVHRAPASHTINLGLFNWSAGTHVEHEYDYNAIAIVGVRRKDKMPPPQNIGTGWKSVAK